MFNFIGKRFFFIIVATILTIILVLAFNQELLVDITKIKQNSDETKYTEKVSSRKIMMDYQKILVLVKDFEEELSLQSNIEYAFSMAKLNYTICNVDTDYTSSIKELNKSDILVIASERFDYKKYNDDIEAFLKKGGHLVSLLRTDETYGDKYYGIIENNGFSKNIIAGFKSENKIFPGIDDIEINSNFITHSIVNLKLSNDVKIYATAEKIPIIFSHNYKNGTTTYVNSTMFSSKENRGLLLQTVGLNTGFFVSSILNSKVIDIDDFPAPIRRGKTKKIYSEYNMNNLEFYRKIWWPNMYNLSKKYNLVYSVFIITTYNDYTLEPIKEIEAFEKSDIIYFGKRFFELGGGEIGLHGYNHNSLTLENQMDHKDYSYNPWQNMNAMTGSIEYVDELINNMIGDITLKSYVPPSNIISKDGILAVGEALENLLSIASLYTGDYELGVYYQEFGPNEYLDGVYDFPRFSSDYIYKDGEMWKIFNGVANIGIVHHFIHPDDILDPSRSYGKTWEYLLGDFEKILSDIENNYFFLEANTLTEAVQKYKKYENLEVYASMNTTNNSISISYKNVYFPVYHYLRSSKNVKNVNGGDFFIIDKDAGLYLIVGESQDIEVFLHE